MSNPLMLLFAVAASATQTGYADLTAIDRDVAAFVGSDADGGSARPQPTDKRLRLARCAIRPSYAWYGNSRATVLVACDMPRGWRLFVPLLNAAATPLTPISSGATVIVRNENISLTARGNGFTVTRAAEALEAGAMGQWIRVRTAAGAAALRGQVIGPGEVEMPIH